MSFLTVKMLKLQSYITYESDDLPGTKALLEQCPPDDSDVLITQACILFKEKKYEEARQKFAEAMNTLGYKPSIAYNISVCFYYMKQYAQSRKYIIEIIEKGIKEHPGTTQALIVFLIPPELGIGSNAEGIEVRSVGNTLTLRETALIEAFNLKAAIEYEMKNCNTLQTVVSNFFQLMQPKSPLLICLQDLKENLTL
jgi:tetratricopeptide repeat protein 30